MKTKIIIITLLLLTAATSFAQNDWFNKFSDHKDITQVTVTKALLRMAPAFTGSVNMNGINIADVANKLDQLDIFTTNKKATSNMMRKEMTAFFNSNKSYEVLMRIKDEDTNVSFYSQKDGNFVKSLIMLVDSDDEYVIIRLLGEFTTEDIQSITGNKK